MAQELNEYMTAGYSASETIPDSPGFSYKIMPLTTSLEGPKRGTNHPHGHFTFYLGQTVSGYSPYDNKKHSGIIKRIYNDDKTGKPVLVYIMDLKINSILPVMVEGLKHLKHTTK